jgi:pimeloyl-ACP methyl ester carboxylesterase
MNSKARTLSAQQAIDLWLQVPRRPISAAMRRTLDAAESGTFAFGDLELPLSSWGAPEDPFVLLVHGWGGHRGQLSAIGAALAEAGYRATAFDAPAHGDVPGEQTNGYEIAQVIKGLVAELGQPYAVVAHSLGSMSTTIALQEGLQARRLVYTGPMRRLHDAMGAFLQMHDLADEVAQQVESAMLERFGADVWEVTALDLQLPGIGLPLLLVHDKQDEVTPYVSSLALKRAYPAAELLTTEGLGHRKILRDPAVIQRIVDFIAA